MQLQIYNKDTGLWVDVSSYVLNLRLVKTGTVSVDYLEAEFLRDVENVVGIIEKGKEVKLVSPYGFGGRVEEVEKEFGKLLRIRVHSYGQELLDVIVNEVYSNMSPEAIVQDLVTKYTNLTYASTETSGITIENIVFKDKKLVEAIQVLAEVLDWAFWTDIDKNFYFESKGKTHSGQTIQTGLNIVGSPKWRYNTSKLCNHIIFQGGQQSFTKKDGFNGDGTTTEFFLTYKPVGSVRVLVDGDEKKPEVSGAIETGDYKIDLDNKKIVFNNPPANGSNIEVYYDYEVPIRIEARDENSIARYGVVMKKAKNTAIKTFGEARRYVQKYLGLYKNPLRIGEIEVVGSLNNVEVGRLITVVDSKEDINEDMIITKIIYKYPANTTILNVGSNEYLLWDWYKEVLERLKELESGLGSSEIIQKYLYFSEKINAEAKHYKITIKTRDRGQMIALDLDYSVEGGCLDNPDLELDYYPDNQTGWQTYYEEVL